MSRIIANRLIARLSRRINGGRSLCSSSISANSPKEPIMASASTILNEQVARHQDDGSSSPSPSNAASNGRFWGFFKFGVFGALTGAAATAGYATYAYTLEEVDEKTKAFRKSAEYAVGDDIAALDKFQAMLHSAFMTGESLSVFPPLIVPAKSIELYLDLRRAIEEHVRVDSQNPSSEKLLPDLHPLEQHVFTLVLDLKETLVYSDWKGYSAIILVTFVKEFVLISRERGWRTFKRPGVDAFLEHLAQFYEIIVYSDQPPMYVDPILERLDTKGCIRYRLSSSATRYQDGKHYRDLSKLNRDPSRIIYVSGHALDSTLQPENSVQIKPWKLEADDTQLLDLIPFLECNISYLSLVLIASVLIMSLDVARHRPGDIRTVLASYQGRDIATEFIERSKDHQKRMQEQRQQNRLWRR
ncbi:hypothetical protein Syun_010716 [Stephania yunnanensis]|uniref:Mitochondrial import inner membrane translocase subunit TIM50 n=1 Tax=Stephania yunnanensis TaxID=152371 RepID=A0AAP0PQ79_9MAGN